MTRAEADGERRSRMQAVPTSELTDAAGVAHAPARGAVRIVSLVPSITETLFALDLDGHIVGRTGFCIHPAGKVRRVAKVGGTKDVKLDVVQALAPSHVIVNIDENTRETVDALRGFAQPPAVVVTHPNAPEDNFALYRLLGGIFGRRAGAEMLCDRLRIELESCAHGVWSRETVLYLIWKDPWMTVASDTYIARTLACVGWIVERPAGGRVGAARYPTIDLQAEVARVDRVLLSTEPYMFRETHVAALRRQFPQRQIELIDGEMTSWYGVRAIEGLAQLQRLRR